MSHGCDSVSRFAECTPTDSRRPSLKPTSVGPRNAWSRGRPPPTVETVAAGSRGGLIRGLGLGVVLARGFSRLGPPLDTAFLKDRRDLGIGDEALPASSSQSKIAQTGSHRWDRGRRAHPFDPCCFRLSAPLVEKMFQKRSTSISAVARIDSRLLGRNDGRRSKRDPTSPRKRVSSFRV